MTSRPRLRSCRTACKQAQRALEESDGAPRPNGSSVDSWFDDMTGWFKPFDDLPDGPALRRHQDTLIEEVCKYLNKDWPAPTGYEGGVANVNPELGAADTASEKLSGWTGLAARNFRENYLEKFDGYTKNLYTATYVAYQTLAVEAKLWETAHRDALNLIKAAKDSVDGMLGVSVGEGFKFALTALTSVITIKQAAVGDKGLTLIKEIAGFGKEGFSKGSTAFTPAQLMPPLKESVDELVKDLKSKEQEIADAINENIRYLNSHEKEYVAGPIAWNLAHSDPEKTEDRQERPPEERGQEQDGTTSLGDDKHEES